MATALIVTLQSQLYSHAEQYGILDNIRSEVEDQAQNYAKGLSANPEFEFHDSGDAKALCVYNTCGREVLIVYFERVYDKGEGGQVKRL